MIKRLQRIASSDDFFRNSFITLLIRLTGVLLQFLILIVITKFFSEEIVGQYNYINTTLILFSSICLLGMGEAFLLFVGKMEAEGNQHHIKSIYKKNVITIFISFFIFLMIYLVLSRLININFFTQTNIRLFDKVFFVLFFSTMSLYNFQVIRGLRKLALSEFFRNIFRYGFLFLMLGIIILFDFDEDFVLNSFLIVFLITALLTTATIVWYLPKDTSRSESNDFTTKKILKISIPMSISFISLLTMQSFDTIMIEYYINIESVAFYTVAVKITFIVGIMQLTINSVIAPDISKNWYNNNKVELRGLINKAIKLNFIFTFPIILVLYFISDTFLLFLGENYIKSQTPLLILLIGQVLNSFCGPVGLYLNMTGRQNVLLKILMISTIVNIALNILIIPIYGITGAAISTSLSMALWNIVGVLYVYKEDNIALIINRSIFR